MPGMHWKRMAGWVSGSLSLDMRMWCREGALAAVHMGARVHRRQAGSRLACGREGVRAFNSACALAGLPPAGTSNSLIAPNSSTLTELGELYLSYRPVTAAEANRAAAAEGTGQQQSGAGAKQPVGRHSRQVLRKPQRAGRSRLQPCQAAMGPAGASSVRPAFSTCSWGTR